MNSNRIFAISILFLLLIVQVTACSGAPAEPAAGTPEQLVAEEPAVQATAPPTSTPVPAEPTPVPATETAVHPTPEPTQEPPTPTPEPTNTPEPPPPWAADLVGVWFKPGTEANGNQDLYIGYNDDGTYRVAYSQGELTTGYAEEGKYWFEGEVLLLVALRGKNSCPKEDIGRWQVEVTPGTSSRFMRVEDPCGQRVLGNEGTWTWVSPRPVADLEPAPTWAADLVGIWFKPGLEAVRGKDYFMQFFDDGTYRVAETQSQLASGYEVEGNYHFEGDVYVALDTGGKIPCPGGEIGRYQLTISPGESMRVMQLEEACRARAANFEGTWTWVSP